MPAMRCLQIDRAGRLVPPLWIVRPDVPLKLISGLALLTSVAPKAGGKCTTAARGREATSAVTAGFSQTAAKLGRAMLSPEFCW